MINLINRNNYKIITLTGKGSSNSKLDYCEISDELVAEIKSKYYDNGEVDEEGNPVLVDLNLVTTFDINPTDTLFDAVETLYYKDRTQAITDYKNNLINESFFGFAFRIEVFDFRAAISCKRTDSDGDTIFPFAEYSTVVIDALSPKNAKIVKKDIFKNPLTLEIRTKAFVYVNFLFTQALSCMASAMTLADDGVTEVPILTDIEPNPVWDLFNESTPETIGIIIE